MEQQIEGQNHQIAGRDVVNNWTIEQNQPKSLSLCSIDELRAQRDFSKEIIKDAEAKIWGSLPSKILMITLPMFFLCWYLGNVGQWLFYAFIIGVVCPGIAQLKFINREQPVIEIERQRLNNIYYILRSYKIDER
ncbi:MULTISPECIES: hypothetical protein [Shewanella]|uniref:hypothetical protein n=1 Tax=Shewanella TaxID=22 RepID=UPI001565CB4E|nr:MULTISPECIES: hypothetical protein [Shewanella]MDR6964732.1 hypothetical protein [Shewanella putrefaciens]NRD31672.1 hypothetical protein [Shewanella sp. DC2-4]